MSAIDPGVDEGIKESAKDVEPDDDGAPERPEEDDFLQPNRWWFASVACPLLAGTFGPMASGFNICALVQYWRQTIPPGEHAIVEQGHKIPDPTWVVVVNALSLISALTGNVTLLLNMARRVKFSIAQPITITGFLLASVLLIADTAALSSEPHYGITRVQNIPPGRHALTQAFYYAIFASIIYMILGLLMCVTVYGANKGHYSKEFHLTSSQRTLMLQTMSFITYLMLGALVFGYIEEWEYLDAIYWADVTLLTVGLGDYHPSKRVTRGLLFPFAIGGILMVGLVVGSIRSLILERGKEKLGARIVEKRRSYAVHNVDDRKQTIKVSLFASADFSTDPGLSPAQRREEEFEVMRKVQRAAQRERRWLALALSSTITAILWFVGAAIFMHCEKEQGWTYLISLYFSYTSLLTIGYGDFSPQSNAGKAFFVLWSLLAVPSLTILISNMGDTVIKWFSDLTVWIGSITVLPGESGLRASLKGALHDVTKRLSDSYKTFTPPGILGSAPMQHDKRMESTEYENKMLDRLAERLQKHVADDDNTHRSQDSDELEDNLVKDMQFYHYVLARECRNVQKHLSVSPPKEYDWGEWEYYLKLMGNEDDPDDFPGQQNPDIMVPEPMKAPDGLASDGSDAENRKGSRTNGGQSSSEDNDKASTYQTAKTKQLDGNVDRRTSVAQHMSSKRQHLHKRKFKNPDEDFWLSWSWLSNESPLMSRKSEAEWVLERLSAALERELNRQWKGYKRKPPISLRDARKKDRGREREAKAGDAGETTKEEESLERAAKGEE